MDTDKTNNLTGDTYVTPPYVAGLGLAGNNVQAIEKYMERVSALPALIQKIMRDFSTAEFIEEKLGPQFGLSPDQKGNLVMLLGGILLADVFVGDMVWEIQNRLQIDQNTATQIASTIVSELFAPALEEIKQVHRQKFEDRATSPKPPSQVQQSAPQPQRPSQPPPPKRTFSNPAASLDINKNNVLDLRNKDQ